MYQTKLNMLSFGCLEVSVLGPPPKRNTPHDVIWMSRNWDFFTCIYCAKLHHEYVENPLLNDNFYVSKSANQVKQRSLPIQTMHCKGKSLNITSNICIKCDSLKNGSHLTESRSESLFKKNMAGDGIFRWQPFRDIDDPYEIVGSVISHMCQGVNLYWRRSSTFNRKSLFFMGLSTPTQVGSTTILLPMRKFIQQDIRLNNV